MTKKVENNPEFLVIKADTNALVEEFRLILKQKIMKILKIEYDFLRTELYDHLCINLDLVVQDLLITKQKKMDPHKVYIYDDTLLL